MTVGPTEGPGRTAERSSGGFAFATRPGGDYDLCPGAPGRRDPDTGSIATDVDIPEPALAGDPSPEHAAAGLGWWVTEELLQRLYAVRQDLAEAGESARDGGRRAEELRDTVLAMIRRLRGVAEMLGQEPAGETSLRTEHLAGLVRTECREARRLLGVDLPDVPRGSARRRP